MALKKMLQNRLGGVFIGGAILAGGIISLLKEMGYISFKIPWASFLLIAVGMYLILKKRGTDE